MDTLGHTITDVQCVSCTLVLEAGDLTGSCLQSVTKSDIHPLSDELRHIAVWQVQDNSVESRGDDYLRIQSRYQKWKCRSCHYQIYLKEAQALLRFIGGI